MNERDRLDRMLTAWTDDMWSPPPPAYLGEVLARTQRTRQRPAWASLERWLPMAVITRPVAAPVPRAWRLVLVFVLLALVASALTAGTLYVGSQLFQVSTSVPTGGSAVLVFDADGDLFTIRADGTDRRQLTSGPERDTAAVWSPDGTRVAFRRVAPEGTSVAVIDAAGGDPVILYTVDPPEDSMCIPHAPAWSPDGEYLVFTADACTGPATIVVASVAGTRGPVDAHPFLPVGTLGSAPSWARGSDDDTTIAFVGTGPDGDGVYLADISDERRIYAEPRFPVRRVSDPDPALRWTVSGSAPLSGPTWSPDGRSVAIAGGTDSGCISATSGSQDAFVIDGRPGRARQVAVAASDAKEYNPTWAPDGHSVAFQRIVEPSERINGRPCTMAVWIADADGANARRLTMLGTDDSQPPFWSPDGTRILGNTVDVVDGVEHYDLYIETIDGSSPVVTVDDVGYAMWQPLAAPVGPDLSSE